MVQFEFYTSEPVPTFRAELDLVPHEKKPGLIEKAGLLAAFL
jgi:hypothetical protein